MTTARERAREAVMKVPLNRGKYAAADAASDIWEPIVRNIVQAWDNPAVNPGELAHRITQAREALSNE